jgi:hypothetical protein
MSANATVATAVLRATDVERRHRIRLAAGYLVAIALVVAVAAYGYDYYTLGVHERPFSPKHGWLRPSGPVGLNLGIFGTLLFFAIFLYPLRKRWDWLSRQGSSRHWLDIHVLMGLTAPFIIAFHSSFKFRGIAGMAFWLMSAVALSGVIGRYVYGQIPRRMSAAELSRKESEELRDDLEGQLKLQRLLPKADLDFLLHLPSAQRVDRLPLVAALLYMIGLDLGRPFKIARLRRHSLRLGEKLLTLGGFLPTRHVQLEWAIETAREEAALSKRILFLTRSQQVFQLWHVVHKPFSYSFAILALVHIAAVMVLGFL